MLRVRRAVKEMAERGIKKMDIQAAQIEPFFCVFDEKTFFSKLLTTTTLSVIIILIKKKNGLRG